MAIFARQMLENQPITLFGSGEQVRDYLYVKDAAQANLAALEPGLTGTFNLGTGQGHSLLEVLRNLSDVLAIKPVIKIEQAHPFEVWRSVLDPSRAGDHLGWQAGVAFEEGVERVVEKLTANS